MQSDGNDVDKTRVFVVHGRNEELRRSMFEFLRSIGLNPIEWSQAIQMTGDAAPFIGDILDKAFRQVQAVVVLLSGDDVARLRRQFHSDKTPDYEKHLTPQARPNVIFEAGFSLGRFPNRTIIIEAGDLRPFSDIVGRHTIRLNNSIEVRQEIAQRLLTAGCSVNMIGADWHTSGNFEVAVQSRLDNEEDPTDNDKLSPTHIKILESLINVHLLNANGISTNIGLTKKLVLSYMPDLLEKNLVSKNNEDLTIAHFSLTRPGHEYLTSIGIE